MIWTCIISGIFYILGYLGYLSILGQWFDENSETDCRIYLILAVLGLVTYPVLLPLVWLTVKVIRIVQKSREYSAIELMDGTINVFNVLLCFIFNALAIMGIIRFLEGRNKD